MGNGAKGRIIRAEDGQLCQGHDQQGRSYSF